MDIPKELEGVLVKTEDTLHGGVRFAGTRIFAYQLSDYILGGKTLDEFLRDFEGVDRVQAETFLAWERDNVHRQLESA